MVLPKKLPGEQTFPYNSHPTYELLLSVFLGIVFINYFGTYLYMSLDELFAFDVINRISCFIFIQMGFSVPICC